MRARGTPRENQDASIVSNGSIAGTDPLPAPELSRVNQVIYVTWTRLVLSIISNFRVFKHCSKLLVNAAPSSPTMLSASLSALNTPRNGIYGPFA